MTRKKVKLAFIVNDSARKATYKKRKKGLLKKVDELSTLCGIEACAIVYSPYDPQPEVWPSPWGVQRVLSKFTTMPEMEQSKKMMNQETFMKQRVLKAKEQVKKQKKDNREKEMTLLMFQCLNAGKILHNNMAMVDLNDLAWLIDQNLKDVDKRLETLNNNDASVVAPQVQVMTTPMSQVQMAPPPPAAPALVVAKSEEMTLMGYAHHGHGGLAMNNVDHTVPRQWFMDMMNGNGDHGVVTNMPFGEANLQNGFWPNLLP